MQVLMKINSNESRQFNSYKKTPLHIAVENDSRNIIETLISKGANLNVKDIDFLNLIF